jgi:hypothetical protein
MNYPNPFSGTGLNQQNGMFGQGAPQGGQQFMGGQQMPMQQPMNQLQQQAMNQIQGFSNAPQGGQQMPMRGNQAFGFANPFGPGYQGQTSQSMLGGFGAGGQGQPGLSNGAFGGGQQFMGGFNNPYTNMLAQQNNPYQTQNFLQPYMPGYTAPQATQPFNLGLGSLNGI